MRCVAQGGFRSAQAGMICDSSQWDFSGCIAMACELWSRRAQTRSQAGMRQVAQVRRISVSVIRHFRKSRAADYAIANPPTTRGSFSPQWGDLARACRQVLKHHCAGAFGLDERLEGGAADLDGGPVLMGGAPRHHK